VQFDLQPCAVTGRRVDLDVLFRNLIDNAVKYAGSPPRVGVQLHINDKKQAVVRIADNGRGIPHHLRRKIFGRFVRLGSELERDKPGTGLGLYIARTLAQRHRGHIRVRDPEEGSGTVFEVQLPGKAIVVEGGIVN
jgi:two-component system, OmpR family, phosphate regulon sensor histidine kinase PhoR